MKVSKENLTTNIVTYLTVNGQKTRMLSDKQLNKLKRSFGFLSIITITGLEKC